MELLLQAGIHLIKKVITFVIYGRSVQVFKACTLFSSRRFLFVGRVLSHRFHRFTQIFFIMIFLHRISQMNRRHSCLSDYSRNFAELWPLANGSRPIPAPVVFCHADFADDADFSLWEVFVPQISQIYTDFSLWGLFCPTDFTDIHRFFMESLLNLFVHSQGGICNDRTGRICENP